MQTREEKIKALEKMLSEIPKNKSTEKMQASIKSKIAKLREQKQIKSGKRITTIPKEGDAQICIIGLTQSGKSILLSNLTNAKPELSRHPYTTAKPEIGTLDYQGVKIQLVEIPSTFHSSHMNIAQNCDGIIIVYDSEKDVLEQKIEIRKILEKFRVDKPSLEILGKREIDVDKTKEKIWKMLGLIRVYCKEPGKNPEKKPLVLKQDSTVADAAKSVHKDFVKFFKFARVFGTSVKFYGERVGLDHILKDGDILEIHIS